LLVVHPDDAARLDSARDLRSLHGYVFHGPAPEYGLTIGSPALLFRLSLTFLV
jgi:hypothetical protein